MHTGTSWPNAPVIEQRRPAPDVRWALASLSIPMLMSSLDTSIANAGLPTLARAFAATFPQVQWIVLAYLLAITTLIVGAGRLGDLVGRRRLLLGGIALFTLASAACGLATTLAQLIAARAAQGLGAAAMMALSLAFVGDTVPRERIGRAMGLLGTMSAIGTALGPSLGGLLIAAAGWRAIFLVNVPIGVASLLLVLRHLPADPVRPTGARGRFDLVGTLLLATALGAYSLALTIHPGHAGAATVALALVALLGASLFVRVETRTANPLVRLDLLRDGALGASLAANAMVATVLMATLVVGPFYLARALGLGVTRVGLLLSVGPLVVALAGVPAGRAVDRFGARRATGAGLSGIAAGAVLLAALPTAAGVAGYVLPIALVTAGYALFQTANNTGVMAGVDGARRGVVSGLLSLSRNLGLVTGASAMGAVFALASGGANTAAPAAVAFGMRVTFAVAAVLILAALALTTSAKATRTSAGLAGGATDALTGRLRSTPIPPTTLDPGERT